MRQESSDPKQALSAPPQLAPLGAGIPLYQKVVLRLYVKPFIAAKSPLEKSKRTFEHVAKKILHEIEGLSDTQLSEPVLVPPQAGLEDSSRFWSIAMTLEHLCIVGRKLGLVISALNHNQQITEKANIAELKPLGKIGAAASIADFRKFAEQEFPTYQVLNPKSKNSFRHPWFGEMTSREWYWLIGIHQGLHLKQIREIKKGLARRSV